MDASPPALSKTLSEGKLVIFKGDANYRRILEDRNYTHDRPFKECVGSLNEQYNVLALRCLKAELGAGMNRDKIKRAREKRDDWLTAGEFGVIQFLKKK